MKQLLKYILAQILDHQKQAETKHSIGIALIGGFCVVIVNFVLTEVVAVRVVAIVALVFCLVALGLSFFAVSSKSINNYKQRPQKNDINFLYYKDIKDFCPEAYVRLLAISYGYPKSYVPDAFELDLSKSVVSIARRTALKYKLFNISILFLGVSVGLIFVSGVLGGLLGKIV